MNIIFSETFGLFGRSKRFELLDVKHVRGSLRAILENPLKTKVISGAIYRSQRRDKGKSSDRAVDWRDQGAPLIKEHRVPLSAASLAVSAQAAEIRMDGFGREVEVAALLEGYRRNAIYQWHRRGIPPAVILRLQEHYDDRFRITDCPALAATPRPCLADQARKYIR